jgi:hypothetical protein
MKLFFILFYSFSSLALAGNFASTIDNLSEKQIATLALKFPSVLDKISLVCLNTNEGKNSIGLWHNLNINAPIKEVEAILLNFNDYSQIFDAIEKAKIIKKTGTDNFLVEFENKSPFFLIPNIHYQMEYIISDVLKGKFFRYHLSELYPQKNIIFSDGLIYLEEVNGVTRFYELDFFKANWGILETFASSKIWSDSIKELVISDFELKIKSEKKGKVKSLLDELDIQKCISNKMSAIDFFKSSR